MRLGQNLILKAMLVLLVKNAIEMRGASAVSNGTMSVLSEGDINIHESRQQERLSEATKWTKHGVFQSKGETRRHNHNMILQRAQP